MSQIKSKERVKKLAEVFTRPEEVNAMLDLVKDKSYKISSRFLEPSCGNGAFLTEILRRKLETVLSKHKTRKTFEFNALKALSSIYGVDISPENIDESRHNMKVIILEAYRYVLNNGSVNKDLFESKNIETFDPRTLDIPFITAVDYILYKNILLGDMLNGTEKIFFSEFVSKRRNYFEERVFTYKQIINNDTDPYFRYEICHYENLNNNKNKKGY